MRKETAVVEVEVKAGKDWPAAKFNVTVNVPETEEEFTKVSNGISSFDFATTQYTAKAVSAATQAYKNQKEGDAEARIAKAVQAAANYALNSRGEGIRSAAKVAEARLDSIADPETRAAVEALIRKAQGKD